eukprot:TRINITY_DN5474_c0_g1_i1.p1 TRINITY_DN5474_c0_g1~~TRINITY_DN5474_c0_g1_i1.p1  ORF type:complete len:838 (-),score=140.84 TRINITY_DN5474_c0_g1_i1:45-2558(-)
MWNILVVLKLLIFLSIQFPYGNSDSIREAERDCQWICTDSSYFDSTDCWNCGRIPSLDDNASIQNATVMATFDTNLSSLLLFNSHLSLSPGVSFSVKTNIRLEANSSLLTMGQNSWFIAKGSDSLINVSSGLIFGNFKGLRIINYGTLKLTEKLSIDSNIANYGDLSFGEKEKKFELTTSSNSLLQNWGRVKVLGTSHLNGLDWANYKYSQVDVKSPLNINGDKSKSLTSFKFQESALSLESNIKISGGSNLILLNTVVNCPNINSLAIIESPRTTAKSIQIQGLSIIIKSPELSIIDLEINNKQLTLQSPNGTLSSKTIVGNKKKRSVLQLKGTFTINSSIMGSGSFIALESSLLVPIGVKPQNWSVKDMKVGDITFIEKKEKWEPILSGFHGEIKRILISFDSYPNRWNQSFSLISHSKLQLPLPSLKVFPDYRCLNPLLSINNHSLSFHFDQPKMPILELSHLYQMNSNDVLFHWSMNSLDCGDYLLDNFKLSSGAFTTMVRDTSIKVPRSKFKSCQPNIVQVDATFTSKLFSSDPIWVHSNHISFLLPVDFQNFRPDISKIKTSFNSTGTCLQVEWDDKLTEKKNYPCGSKPMKLEIISEGGNKSIPNQSVDISKKISQLTIPYCTRYSLSFRFIFSYNNSLSSPSASIVIFNAPTTRPLMPIYSLNDHTVFFSWKSSPRCKCKEEFRTSFFRIVKGSQTKDGIKNIPFDLDQEGINDFKAVAICVYQDGERISEHLSWSIDPSMHSTQYSSNHHASNTHSSSLPSESSSGNDNSRGEESKSRIVTKIALIVAGVFGMILILAIAFVVIRHIRNERIHQQMLEQERNSLLHFS